MLPSHLPIYQAYCHKSEIREVHRSIAPDTDLANLTNTYTPFHADSRRRWHIQVKVAGMTQLESNEEFLHKYPICYTLTIVMVVCGLSISTSCFPYLTHASVTAMSSSAYCRFFIDFLFFCVFSPWPSYQ